VGPDATVVLYGGNNNWFATYAYWLLRYLGFDRVKLMDGGRKKWELEEREVVTDEPSVAEADPGPLTPVRDELRAFRDDVLGHIGGSGKTMVDVRSPAEFSGEVLAPPHLPQEQAQVPGHIPGAANVPWATAAREDGAFKSDQELTEIYGGVGVSPDTDVIAYCRIGERSSHTWFVLHELLGYERVRNYDGSWTEYGSLVGVPVER
jgi:thiosulfate/3-mercaptopyruvate sulfurtransferase